MTERVELFRGARSFPSSAEASGHPEALRRIAVIDVGSNSVRLVVFHGPLHAPSHFFNEKVLCGLGRDLRSTGRLHPEGRTRALAAITRFAALAERMHVTALNGIATAAVRDALDGDDFCEDVWRACRLRVRIASGDDEARLAGQGVLLGWPDADGVVLDIGGASMEIARVGPDGVGDRISTPLGPQRLTIEDHGPEQIDATIKSHLLGAKRILPGSVPRLYLVGGAWRGLARLHMNRVGYPFPVLHGYRVLPDDLAETAAWAVATEPSQIVKDSRLSQSRAETLPAAARVLGHVLTQFSPGEIVVSAFGLREGLLYDHLPPNAQRRDPLIEACRAQETASARFPGFGDTLHDWVKPVMSAWSPESRRLARAACFLHDVNWQVHPDFRAMAGFDTITRASLSGVDHRGRMFIGVALYHRYKSGRKLRDTIGAMTLLEPHALVQAETLGYAMRLGAMLSASAPGSLDTVPISVTPVRLTLTLRAAMRDLGGEVVEKRLDRLASALGLSSAIKITD